MKKTPLGGLPQKIGVNLVWILVDRHISVSTLEKGTGIYKTRLSRIMNGTGDLTVSELEKICNFLEIKIEEVIKDDASAS